jgi:hypothetical protein
MTRASKLGNREFLWVKGFFPTKYYVAVVCCAPEAMV